MKRRAPPATPEQVAIFGHIAARLRAELAKRKWAVGDFNEALGYARGNPSVYHWLNAKGGPAPEARAKLAKLFGIPEGELMRRKGGLPVAMAASPAVVLPPASTGLSRPRATEVLGFTVNGQGEARIRLDVTLPVASATPLLRMLLDAGFVLGAPDQESSE